MSEGRGVGVPGYDFGDRATAGSPLDLEDQADEVLDLWYGYVGSHLHLIRYFADPNGEPDAEYLERVRERFKQWIFDTCRRPYDQEWLDYQQEIALRHTRAKKNQTDGAYEAPEHIPLRYMITFIYPITATIKPFLANKGHGPEEVEKMFQAWFKSVVLQVTLWSYPYAKEGDF